MAKANKHFRIERAVKRMQALMNFPKGDKGGHSFKNLMIDAQFRPYKGGKVVEAAAE